MTARTGDKGGLAPVAPTDPAGGDEMTDRRAFLWQAGGLAAVATQWLLAGPTTHHAPKVKRIIQLFMNGGASQMDLFDHKPALNRLHGKKFDPGAGVRVEGVTSVP